MQSVVCFYQQQKIKIIGFRKHVGYKQGGTKASHKRGQITLGVFPNCHECPKIDFPVLKKPSAIY